MMPLPTPVHDRALAEERADSICESAASQRLMVMVCSLAQPVVLGRIVTTAIGHLAGFLLVERVYHAGRAQLLTIPWFARIMGWIDAIRQVVIGRIKASAAWQRAVALVRAVRERLRSMKLWFARRRA
jgi:hypothetical protein